LLHKILQQILLRTHKFKKHGIGSMLDPPPSSSYSSFSHQQQQQQNNADANNPLPMTTPQSQLISSSSGLYRRPW
jgi:hypothetical protein